MDTNASQSTIVQLQQIPLFKGIDVKDIEILLKMMDRLTYPAQTVLFHKDDPGDTMYFILSGRIRIFMEDTNKNQITFRYFGAGQIFGEFSILDQRPRSASAAAGDDEPLTVLALKRDNFIAMLKDRPIIGLAMMRNLAERIRYTHTYLEKIRDWTRMLSNGEYERAIEELTLSATDDDMQKLIGSFLQLVHTMRDRLQAVEEPSDQASDVPTSEQPAREAFVWSDFADKVKSQTADENDATDELPKSKNLWEQLKNDKPES